MPFKDKNLDDFMSEEFGRKPAPAPKVDPVPPAPVPASKPAPIPPAPIAVPKPTPPSVVVPVAVKDPEPVTVGDVVKTRPQNKAKTFKLSEDQLAIVQAKMTELREKTPGKTEGDILVNLLTNK